MLRILGDLRGPGWYYLHYNCILETKHQLLTDKTDILVLILYCSALSQISLSLNYAHFCTLALENIMLRFSFKALQM